MATKGNNNTPAEMKPIPSSLLLESALPAVNRATKSNNNAPAEMKPITSSLLLEYALPAVNRATKSNNNAPAEMKPIPSSLLLESALPAVNRATKSNNNAPAEMKPITSSLLLESALPAVNMATKGNNNTPAEMKPITSSLLLESVLADSTIDRQVHGEQDQEEVLRKALVENRSSLEQVMNQFKNVNSKPLSSIDNTLIGTKYVKFCSKLWLQEVTKFLKDASEQNNSSALETVFRHLDSVQDIRQIPFPLNHLEYYKLLLNHREWLNKEDERLIIELFKKQFLEQTVPTNTIKKEIVFIDMFLHFLENITNLKLIVSVLQLQNFYAGKVTFDKVLDNIMKLDVNIYGETLSTLQRETKNFQKTKGSFPTEKLKEIIGDYIKPAEVKVLKIDDRWVIEVTGRCIVVSEILQRLESEMSRKNYIEEVRFVCKSIHVDASLRNEVWHGKNLVVLTQKVKVDSRVTWDISGEDSTETYSSNAGTGVDGHGRQGRDGFPGESGGNVLVRSNEIENPDYLTIVSNGGRGSEGQDGGNGLDGIDGSGYTQEDLVRKLSLNIKTLEFSHTLATARSMVLSVLTKQSVSEHSTDNNLFIEGRTEENYEVTVSYRAGGYLRMPHGLVLVKGTAGSAGGRGGEYGLGGIGGFNGKIIVNNARTGVVIVASPGEYGKNGKGGLHGSLGKDGWDIGYTDYKLWNTTNFVGYDQNKKLKLIYSDIEIKGSSVWCGKVKKYVTIEIAGLLSTTTKNVQRNETRQDSKRQHHAQATRKKSISEIGMSTTYAEQISSAR